jgi:hypothetical protein
MGCFLVIDVRWLLFSSDVHLTAIGVRSYVPLAVGLLRILHSQQSHLFRSIARLQQLEQLNLRIHHAPADLNPVLTNEFRIRAGEEEERGDEKSFDHEEKAANHLEISISREKVGYVEEVREEFEINKHPSSPSFKLDSPIVPPPLSSALHPSDLFHSPPPRSTEQQKENKVLMISRLFAKPQTELARKASIGISSKSSSSSGYLNLNHRRTRSFDNERALEMEEISSKLKKVKKVKLAVWIQLIVTVGMLGTHLAAISKSYLMDVMAAG